MRNQSPYCGLWIDDLLPCVAASKQDLHLAAPVACRMLVMMPLCMR